MITLELLFDPFLLDGCKNYPLVSVCDGGGERVLYRRMNVCISSFPDGSCREDALDCGFLDMSPYWKEDYTLEVQNDAIQYVANQTKAVKYQRRHYGIDIPLELQPKCNYCGGPMAISIMYPNDECHAFWACISDNNCIWELSKEVDLKTWLEAAPKNIQEHFLRVGMSQSEIVKASLTERGFTLVGGHNWGGGTWGTLEGKKAWTGYKGQSLEYWQKSASENGEGSKGK